MNLTDSNASSPAARLAATRLKQWHQQGEALLTIENARSFLNSAGLVLFAPRPQIAAPAPSFVEAVLGATNATPSLAQAVQANDLLARLVAEGLAVPLNLLGLGSVIGRSADAPDFIANAQVFSYIFTLRGDKAWKQPPPPAIFSNLAIATHELLSQRGPSSASDLARELGNEVTESAVLRALGELWSHLRVLPLPQLDGRATLWELATARLTKQIKAGVNAGQPTALSALISLYLGQAIVGSEDEIESFLSPLAARSRIRDVVHALAAARQLATVAIEGKTVLHVAGAALEFLTEGVPVAPDAQEEDGALEEAVAAEAEAAEIAEGGEIEAEPGSRIAKFVPKRKAAERELAKAKPAKGAKSARSVYVDKRKSSGAVRKPFGEKKPFASREGRERPAFRDGKSARPFGERRGFKRSERTGERAERPRRFEGEGRPPFEKKRFASRDGDAKPRFERRDREGARPNRERRPFVRDDRGGERPPRRFSGSDSAGREQRRPFNRHEDRGDHPARKPFGKPDRFAPKREFASGEDRPKRDFKPRSFEGRKPFGGPRKSSDRPKPYGRRSDSGESGEENRAAHGFGGKRPFAKSGGGFGKKPGGFSKPFRGRERGEDRSEGGARDGAGFAGKRFGSDKPRGARPGGAGGRFGAKKFGARPGGAKFGGKPGGAKFGAKKFGAKKPFGKPGGPRGPRPSRPKGDREA